MTEKVKKYRQKHHKCKYCINLRYNSRYENCGGSEYFFCEAKEKIINRYSPDMTNVPRWFCQCYEVKDGKDYSGT